MLPNELTLKKNKTNSNKMYKHKCTRGLVQCTKITAETRPWVVCDLQNDKHDADDGGVYVNVDIQNICV